MTKHVYKEIVGKLDFMFTLHRYYIHKAAAKTELYRGQLQILEVVRKNENCTQKEIAEAICVSPPSVATSVKRMQKAGLLEKIQDEQNLRNNQIRLTDKGIDLSEKCRTEFDKIDKQLFCGFSEEECSQLYHYIERMISNLTTEEINAEAVFKYMKSEHFKKQKYEGKDSDDK